MLGYNGYLYHLSLLNLEILDIGIFIIMLIYLLGFEIPDVGIFIMLIYHYWVLKYLMSGYFICSFMVWVLKYLMLENLYAHLSLLGFEIPDVGIFICSFLVIGF